MSKYGFVAVPIDVQAHLKGKEFIHAPTRQSFKSLTLPDSKSAKTIIEYAKKNLPLPAFNHSMRVYFYGVAILKDQFPDWDLDLEVYLATSLLHDIGTTDANLKATKLSFEYYGGYLARDLILKETNDQDYAEAASEAIIRHQDLGTVGNITQLGFLLQLTTILDNAGKNTGIIDTQTVYEINEAYPRLDWLNCFANVIDSEYAAKPWCHTSAVGIDHFKNLVLGNNFQYEPSKEKL
ncbi:Ddi2p [Sugiyamaella lignohabitans]|uniref:Ddi2p n=1 Tax=Sugiyamaella lignohabitans TaxID=796027 RepID=A0A167DFE0_9ASCO|nr:Ddi2p [Sugiyamaella lignohabitans]ANB12855.1 Ddi2p [Sugiyamaella lignohabitans]